MLQEKGFNFRLFLCRTTDEYEDTVKENLNRKPWCKKLTNRVIRNSLKSEASFTTQPRNFLRGLPTSLLKSSSREIYEFT